MQKAPAAGEPGGSRDCGNELQALVSGLLVQTQARQAVTGSFTS